VRLATIRAAGHGFRDAEITVQDIQWGTGIAETSARQAFVGAQKVVPINERGRWVDRLLNYIRARNLEGKLANARTFQQHIRCALKAAEVRDMIAQLIYTCHLEQRPDGSLHCITETIITN